MVVWLLFFLAAHSELSSLLLRELSPTPIQPVHTGSRHPQISRPWGMGCNSGSGNTGWFSRQRTAQQARLLLVRLLLVRLHVHAFSPRESSTSVSHLPPDLLCHQSVTHCSTSFRKCTFLRTGCDRVAFKCSESYYSPSPWLDYLQLNMSEQQHSKLFF